MAQKSQKHLFIGGMDLDSAPGYLPENKYRLAKNVQLVVDKDSTQGEIRPVVGLSELNIVADKVNDNESDQRKSENVLKERIIGMKSIRNLIVVITERISLEDGKQVIKNCIYKLTRDDVDYNKYISRWVCDGVFNIGRKADDVFDEQGNIKYLNKDAISIVLRWHNDERINCYVADGINYMFVFNIANVNIESTRKKTSITAVSAISQIYLPQPKDLRIVTGALQSGVYQLTYRLISNSGVTTDLAPFSKKISIVNAETSDLSFTPGPSGERTEKGISVPFQTPTEAIDQFDKIEWYVIHYVDETLKIYLANERNLDFESATFHFSGSGFTEVELSEFQVLSNYLFIPKVIESKENILFAGNIIEKNFNSSFEINGKLIDIDNYDTRAWGFDMTEGSPTIATCSLSVGNSSTVLRMYTNSSGEEVSSFNVDDTSWFNLVPKNADATTPLHSEENVNKNIYTEINLHRGRYTYHPSFRTNLNNLIWGGKGKNVEFKIIHTHLGCLPKPGSYERYPMNFTSYDNWTVSSGDAGTRFGTEQSRDPSITPNPSSVFKPYAISNAYPYVWNEYITDSLSKSLIHTYQPGVYLPSARYLIFRNNVPAANSTANGFVSGGFFNEDHKPFQYDWMSRSYTNPYLNPTYAGYQHDSLYRMAVVFHFSNGRRTSPMFIGDIRTPSLNDQNHRGFDFNSMINIHSGNEVYDEGFGLSSYPMGFEFTFNNLQSYFKGELKAIEIVRSERKTADRPILYNGIIGQTSPFTYRDNITPSTYYTDSWMPLPFMSFGNNMYYNITDRSFANWMNGSFVASHSGPRKTYASSGAKGPIIFTSPEICIERNNSNTKVDNTNRLELLYGISGVAAIKSGARGRTSADSPNVTSHRDSVAYLGALPNGLMNSGIISPVDWDQPAYISYRNMINTMLPYPTTFTMSRPSSTQDWTINAGLSTYSAIMTSTATSQIEYASPRTSWSGLRVVPYRKAGGMAFYLNFFNSFKRGIFGLNQAPIEGIPENYEFQLPLIVPIKKAAYAKDLDYDVDNPKTERTHLSVHEGAQTFEGYSYFNWTLNATSTPKTSNFGGQASGVVSPWSETTRSVGGPHGPCVLLNTGEGSAWTLNDWAPVILRAGLENIGGLNGGPNYTQYFSMPHQQLMDRSFVGYVNETPDSVVRSGYDYNGKGLQSLATFWCNLRQHAQPYGGSSYSSVSSTDTYVSTTFLKELNGSENSITIQVFGGDVYLTYATYADSYSSYSTNNSYVFEDNLDPSQLGRNATEQGGYLGVVYPGEFSVNPHYLFGNRLDKVFNENRPTAETMSERKQEAWLHEGTSVSGYSQAEDHYLYHMAYDNAFPIKFTDVFKTTTTEASGETTSDFKYDYRVLYSDPIVGTAVTTADPWLKWNPLQYRDVDTRKGEITDLKTYNNTLYFWQTSAFGALSVNDRALLPMEEDTDLVLGVSGVLSHHTYLNTYNGKAADQLNASCTFPGVDVLWYDDHNKEILTYVQGNQELSKTVGVQSVLNKIPNGYNWVTCAYNRKFNEVYTTIKPSGTGFSPTTMTYHEYVKGFTSLHTMYPYFYANVYNDLISVDRIPSDTDKPNHFAKHNTDGNSNTFHNRQLMPTEFTIQTTADFNATKTFDNTLFHSDNLLDSIGSDDAISDINIYYKTALQSKENLQFRNMNEVVDSQREETFRLAIPREDENDPNADHSRLKGKWLNTKFVLDLKDKTKTFNIPYVETYYRVSNT